MHAVIYLLGPDTTTYGAVRLNLPRMSRCFEA